MKLLLIKPSKYDDDGYVMRYVRGVLPSNTLATLAALTEEVIASGSLGDVRLDIEMLDEHVQRIDPPRLMRRHDRRGARVVVALCGVQTNQFPRAADLALAFQRAGATVMLGGFHVSGAIAMSRRGMPPECQALIDQGVTLVKGEVEDCWVDILRDALHARLRPYYDITQHPDLSSANVPTVDPRLMRRYAYPNMGTIDAGRGCPFQCSFCTIINVQGRRMRCRSADKIRERIEQNRALNIDFYFFTDDNFARNPNWEAIFDELIDLRAKGDKFHFMIQVDTQGYRIPNFVRKATEAGCSQIFIGMETLNPENIQAAGKRQNRIEDYRHMIDVWHAYGIACHVGYIIGFPADTVASVREDVRRLRQQVGVDQASFFILTPLPGSADHAAMVESGQWMHDDYNRFDSFQPVTHHPRMSDREWRDAYTDAWRDFYSIDSMKSILARANNNTYWGLFKDFIWYKYSAIIERTHPMICGFFRLKDRRERRPGYPIPSRWAHLRRRLGEWRRWTRDVVRFYFEMQEVWLATRGRARIQGNIEGLREEMRRRYDEMRNRLSESATRAGHALSSQVHDMRTGAEDAWQRTREDLAVRLKRLRRRNNPTKLRWRRRIRRINLLSMRRIRTRTHLNDYWRQTYDKLRRGRIWRINPVRLTLNFLRDVKLCALFNLSLFGGFGK